MSVEAVEKEALKSRLGTPKEIATAAVQASRARFARRHPILIYLLLPIPSLLLLWIAYTLGLAGILQVFKQYQDTQWAPTAVGILIHSLAYVPAVALTLAIAWIAWQPDSRCVVARRHRVSCLRVGSDDGQLPHADDSRKRHVAGGSRLSARSVPLATIRRATGRGT